MSDSPAGPATDQASASFEIKSAQLPLVALLIKSDNWQRLGADLLQQYGPKGDSPDFFDHDALVLDFSLLDPELPVSDLVPLLQQLRTCRLVPIALRGASPAWMHAVRRLGLVEAEPEVARPQRPRPALPVLTETVVREPAREVIHEVIREVVREVPGPSAMVIDKPLRSGQKIYARGTDLVVMAMVNPGAEVAADGNIHVYAPLRGRAMAGASGNVQARIFALNMDPELISIAGVYRTSEHPLPANVQGKPAQVRLSNDGQDKLLFDPLNS